jgi:hypothetical protein
MKHRLLVGAVVALCGLAIASPTAADATKGGQLTLQCTSLGTVVINTSSGNGPWTPGQAAVGNMVLHPYEFHIAGTFTPADGSPAQSFSEDSVKNAPRNGRLDTCTFSQTFTDVYGTGTFAGTVKVAYTA